MFLRNCWNIGALVIALLCVLLCVVSVVGCTTSQWKGSGWFVMKLLGAEFHHSLLVLFELVVVCGTFYFPFYCLLWTVDSFIDWMNLIHRGNEFVKKNAGSQSCGWSCSSYWRCRIDGYCSLSHHILLFFFCLMPIMSPHTVRKTMHTGCSRINSPQMESRHVYSLHFVVWIL